MSKLTLISLFLILTIGYSNSIWAQTPTILLLSADSSYRQSSSMIQVNANGLVGSNSLNIGFLKKSFFGGHLEDTHLDKLYQNMKSQNRAGFLANGGIELYNFSDTLFGKPNWGMRAGFSTNYNGFLSFNRDLFKTIYRGNKSFADETTQLGPIIGGYQAWQKFGAGIFHKKNWSSATLSLVAGQQYQSLIASSASLYTSLNGDSLSLAYAGDYMRSDSSKKGFANGSGLGLAIDLNYNLPLADNKGVISIAVYDLGFIAWNKASQRFRYDSLTSWTGIQADNLFDLGTDSLGLPKLRDTLNFEKQNKAMTTALPISMHMRYSRFINKSNLYEFGISIWPNRAAVPFLYAGASQFIGERFMLSERISYGGYGKFGIGVEAQWMPLSSWLLRLGSNNIEGLITKEAYAMSGYFSIGKFFGRQNDSELKIEN